MRHAPTSHHHPRARTLLWTAGLLALIAGCDTTEPAEPEPMAGGGKADSLEDLLEETCPDPEDPRVHYVSQSVGTCLAVNFTCEEGQTLFQVSGPDSCGCGCIDNDPAPPPCPDPDDPDIHYLSRDAYMCSQASFVCGPEQSPFRSDCGCGCEDTEPAGGACPNPLDPAVSFASDDPDVCALLPIECGAGETPFSGDCGCGCISDGQPQCPDPDDPKVHYVSQSVGTCLAVFFTCEEDQQLFQVTGPDSCGCGCIDV